MEGTLIHNNSIGEQRDMNQKEYKKKYITLRKIKVSAPNDVEKSILTEILNQTKFNILLFNYSN